MEKIAVLGAGSWGITIAIHLQKKGFNVALWEFYRDYCVELKKKRECVKFLPGIKISRDILITENLVEALDGANIVVLAVPSHAMRNICGMIKDFDISDSVIVSLAKGIENKTLMRMSEVIAQQLPLKKKNIVVLSGPSHAEEVVRNIPTTIVSASRDLKKAEFIQKIFSSPYLRVYTNTDIVGVELGGALKNIIAIACGISDGLGFGDNTKAALMTRGIYEITRLGVAMGADPKTFSGLSGIGDLITTCTSRHSRNRNFGEMLGKGLSPKKALAKMIMVVEGVKTTKSAYELSKKYKIDMPITEQIYKILFKNKSAANVGKDLMMRQSKAEQH